MRLRSLVILAIVLACLPISACTSTSSGKSPTPSAEEVRLTRLAADIERRGDKKTALPLYEQAARISSDPAMANIRLGNARLAAGEPDGAAAAFRKALATDAQNSAALLGLGTAQMRSGEIEGAARTLRVAAPLVKSPSAFNRLGTALILVGDGSGAQAAFAQASALEPSNLDTLSNLALAQALSGRMDESAGTIAKAVASPRAEARHFRNQMLILTLASREKEAAAVAVPDYPEAEKRQFLAEARKIRTIRDPAKRARAIGLLAAA